MRVHAQQVVQSTSPAYATAGAEYVFGTRCRWHRERVRQNYSWCRSTGPAYATAGAEYGSGIRYSWCRVRVRSTLQMVQSTGQAFRYWLTPILTIRVASWYPHQTSLHIIYLQLCITYFSLRTSSKFEITFAFNAHNGRVKFAGWDCDSTMCVNAVEEHHLTRLVAYIT